MTVHEESDQHSQPLFEELQVWHAFLLRKASQRVTEMAEARLVPLGITLRQFGILNVVAAEPGLNQRAVGSKLRIDRTTIVSLVDDLERAKLIERRRGADRRTFAVHLTDRGQVFIEEARNCLAQVHEAFLEPLSADEADVLRSLLLRLVADGGTEDEGV